MFYTLFIFDGDLFKAYDTVSHALGIERLVKKGLRRITIAALFREIRKLRFVVRAGDIQTAEITRTRSLCQGGPDAPQLFNLIFDFDLCEFNKECEDNSWGCEHQRLCVGRTLLC